jgi:hypothetical protein
MANILVIQVVEWHKKIGDWKYICRNYGLKFSKLGIKQIYGLKKMSEPQTKLTKNYIPINIIVKFLKTKQQQKRKQTEWQDEIYIYDKYILYIYIHT